MKYIEIIFTILVFLVAATLSYSQWKKSRNLQKRYISLSEDKKKNLDKVEYERQNSQHFLYSNPMTKGMLVSVFIALGVFIWVLLTKI